ncbi:MAG: uroporphyrinogen-III C-methyltransferase [Caldimonas sp.]
MNDAATPATDPSTPVVLPVTAGSGTAFRGARLRRAWLIAGAALVLAVIGVGLAWRADQRVRNVEQELVRRQQESAGQASEARLFAKQAQDSARDAAAKVALLEARVAEGALQRSQLEELMTSLSRSRDENLLVDVEAAIRVAGQQTAITGSAEPLVAALKQSEERLARYNQPRLEGVRRAIARDLDRVRAASVADISTLTIRLDEAIRMVDELALPGSALARSDASRTSANASPASRGSVPAGAASAPLPSWGTSAQETATQVLVRAWDEVRSLVRVTRIDHPDAVLLAPEQAFFVKENLKLRLLNARLALLSRQFDTAQSDLQVAQASLDRYFDRSSKRTALAAELIRQVASQAKQGGVPRPDDTLAAVTAAAAGR